MEAPQTKLESFSAVLIEEYIRLMTAADYLKNEGKTGGTEFKIKPEIYEKLQAEELHNPLIGLMISYEKGILTATPDEEFLRNYDNKIMKEVVFMFAENYKNRYDNFVSCCNIE
ncbi:MAG: hypothetical protein J6039_02800 [Alphaproteobacteria bacterium]|nr:hypothetical protein [Alphaproteobacteria bacterium]